MRGAAFFLILVLVSVGVMAGAPEPVRLPGSMSDHFRVVETFAGPDGLIGLVLEDATGERAVAWATSSGRYLLLGELVSPDGRRMTSEKMRLVGSGEVGGPDDAGLSAEELRSFREELRRGIGAPLTAVEFYRRAISGEILDGGIRLFPDLEDPRPLVIFFDPLCSHCAEYYRQIRDMEPRFRGAGRQVVFLPVWSLEKDSLVLGAGILFAGERRAEALDAVERGDADRFRGLVSRPEVGSVSWRDQRRAVMRNTALFVRAGKGGGVPLTAWMRENGEPVLVTGRIPREDLGRLIRGEPVPLPGDGN